MKFGSIPIEEAEGKILAHNIPRGNGRSAFRKGKTLGRDDVRALKEDGFSFVYAAELEGDDIPENEAAGRIAAAAMGTGIRLKRSAEGKASLAAASRGILRVDAVRLEQVNICAGIAFATLPSFTVVEANQIVASVKIIPYGMASNDVVEAESCVKGPAGMLTVHEFEDLPVGLLFFAYPAASERLIAAFLPPLEKRITALGSHVDRSERMALTGDQDEHRLARQLTDQIAAGVQMIILVSETSTMDRNDIAPQAVVQAGGEIISVGAPVDPGNLLLVAYIGSVPVIGVPGCARSSKPNVIDRMFPALLSGDRLSRQDIARLGHGGLLGDK